MVVGYARNGIVIGWQLLVRCTDFFAKEPDLLFNFCVCLPFLSKCHFLSRNHMSHFQHQGFMGKISIQQEMQANTKIKQFTWLLSLSFVVLNTQRALTARTVSQRWDIFATCLPIVLLNWDFWTSTSTWSTRSSRSASLVPLSISFNFCLASWSSSRKWDVFVPSEIISVEKTLHAYPVFSHATPQVPFVCSTLLGTTPIAHLGNAPPRNKVWVTG